ncbi:MAG: metal ABC transporter permease [Acidiferrobacterales bacterium]|nr:metal ABC transporter permease [Acidiferrobacterales bacterium]
MIEVFDDFISRALIAGIGFAVIAGPLGCFVVWQRLAYFGDTIAHSALLGIALALALDINFLIGVFAICLLIALIVGRGGEESILSADSTLGVLSHSTLAIGLVIVSLMYWVRVDILHFLFGNILAVSWSEIAMIYSGGVVIIFVLIRKWSNLISLTVDEELATAENMQPFNARMLMMVLMAAIVAIAMKIVGVILTVSLLIIPAAAARHFARSPEQMAALATVFAVISVILGILSSVEFDTPPGPSIVVNAVGIFIVGMITTTIIRKFGRRSSKAV